MNSDVGGGAESAVGVGFVAVGVGVRDLNGAEDDDQQDTEEREEDSPGSFGARAAEFFTHTIQLYSRMRGRYLRMRGWVEEGAQGGLVEDGDVEGAGAVELGVATGNQNDRGTGEPGELKPKKRDAARALQ